MRKIRLAIILFIFSTLQMLHAIDAPLVDYRLDECYFLGGANGVSGDVLDNTAPTYNATSVNRIDSDQAAAKICRSGAFDDGSYAVVDTPFTLGTNWTLSVWINFPFVQDGKKYYILGSYPGTGDLPVFEYNRGKLKWGIYDNNRGYSTNKIDNSLNGWHHLVFVNENKKTTLYVDGKKKNSINRGTSGTVQYLWASSDDLTGQSIASNIDEMKIFGSNLNKDDIKTVYNNENDGNNYDGTARDCPSCSSAPIAAHTWELIGIPADLRSGPKTVSDLFSDDMVGVFNTDWRIYKRTYSTTDNSSGYYQMALTDTLEFGEGYWLGSSLDERWDIDGTTAVDYDSPSAGCQSTECIELDIKSVIKNFGAPDNDPNDGSGPYRYYTSGYIGLEKPVDWSDCRFIVTNIDGSNEEILTPSEMETADYTSKQIWLYNPNGSGVDDNGYTTCDDVTPGSCMLLPFKGFIVELHGKTKNKTVKLLIPKE